MTIIKKFEPEEPKKSFSRKYLVLVVGVLFVLALTQIWVSNLVIFYGEKFEKLAILQKNLTAENQILANKIAQDASLNNIASKSAELGFSASLSIEYIR